MTTASSIHLSIDKDVLLTAISSAADLIRDMDMMALSQECQEIEILLAAMQLQAATARACACNVATASNTASPPPSDFPYSQAEAARIVCGALGLDTETFRKNKPWRLLEQHSMGEGTGFSKPLPAKNGGETRRYAQVAIDFLSQKGNWGKTRGWL